MRPRSIRATVWALFAVWLLVVLVLGGFVVLGTRRADRELSRITTVHQPLTTAAFEMEINTIGTGMGVLKYLETGATRYRGRVEEDGREFAEFAARFLRLATQPGLRRLGQEADSLFGVYRGIGLTLMDGRDSLEVDRQALFAAFERIDAILDDQLQSGLDPAQSDQAKKLAASLQVEVQVGEVGTWLGSALLSRQPVHRALVQDNIQNFAVRVAQWRQLGLDRRERRLVDRLEREFRTATVLVNRALGQVDSSRTRMTRFLEIRTRLDGILDEEIQAVVDLEHATANRAALRATRAARAGALFVLGVSLVIGTLAAVRSVRSVGLMLDPLIAGVHAVQSRDWGHRITAALPGELVPVAQAFNRMSEDLGANVRELKRQHDALEKEVADRTADLATANEILTAQLAGSRRLEEEARTASERLESVLRNSPLAVCVTSLDGTVLSWNPTAEQIFQWPAAAAVGRPLPIVPADRLVEARTVREAVCRGETVTGFETRRARKDGSEMEVSLSAAPLRDGSTEVNGVIYVYTDITDRNLLERQLRQSLKMEAIGLLAGGIAHDFNNMLTAILGNAELLLADLPPGAPGREEATQIREVTLRSADLTRQLLAYSRRQVLLPAEVNLNQVVRGMEPMLQRLLPSTIAVTSELAPDLLPVVADANQVEQIILNLALNARDAMPDGGPLVLRTANVELDEPYARSHVGGTTGAFGMLAVTDTGAGMTREVQAQIFDPFFTTKELGQGTGLGLSTVYGIVKQSGGFIWVYSEPGRGTTFKTYLPRARLGGLAEPMRAVPHRAEAGRGRGETILLVEDDPSIRRAMRRTLEGLGYRVLDPASGTAALHLVAEQGERLDLVLTDVMMPDLSGPQLVARLRASAPNLKVLFMSGLAVQEAFDGLHIGPNSGFLEKPFSREALALGLRSLLDAAPVPSAGPEGAAPHPSH